MDVNHSTTQCCINTYLCIHGVVISIYNIIITRHEAIKVLTKHDVKLSENETQRIENFVLSI